MTTQSKIDRETLIAVQREVELQDGVDSLAISARSPATLKPLLQRIEAATSSASSSSETVEELPVSGG